MQPQPSTPNCWKWKRRKLLWKKTLIEDRRDEDVEAEVDVVAVDDGGREVITNRSKIEVCFYRKLGEEEEKKGIYIFLISFFYFIFIFPISYK